MRIPLSREANSLLKEASNNETSTLLVRYVCTSRVACSNLVLNVKKTKQNTLHTKITKTTQRYLKNNIFLVFQHNQNIKGTFIPIV